MKRIGGYCAFGTENAAVIGDRQRRHEEIVPRDEIILLSQLRSFAVQRMHWMSARKLLRVPRLLRCALQIRAVVVSRACTGFSLLPVANRLT